MNILFLAAEADPLAKVGGLGDVAGSLPAALNSLPEKPDIRVAIPFYSRIKDLGLDITQIAEFSISHSRGSEKVIAYQIHGNEYPIYLIDGGPVKGSTEIYSGDNELDGRLFTFFSLSALKLVEILEWKPDILHANDWHTSPAVYKLSLSRENGFFSDTKSLLTVHNLPYQGHGSEISLQEFGLPRAHLSPLPEWAEGIPLPLGLLSADLINTVSNGYAEEMLTPDFGADLEEFLQTREADLRGILNGLDQEQWNPENDPHIPANYNLDSLPNRDKNKISLLKELGLPDNPGVPLMAMINRMDYQKGVDLLPEALTQISGQEWQVIILGTGDFNLEEQAKKLDIDFPQVRTEIKFDAGLAHRIYAGSDLILIPSRYEPCGLTQMIGMRYGCVPLARNTGGLSDTIVDYKKNMKESTGFLFNNATSSELAAAIAQAIQIFKDKRRWRGLQRRGMKMDFSWERSANEYIQLYEELIQ